MILILTITCSIFLLPSINAQIPLLTRITHAYIGATPNPIGVGQETLLHVGIAEELQLYHHGWEGLTVTVTKPDNTTETIGPFRTDSTGGTGTVYIPNMIGTYYFQTHFPAQRYNWTLFGGASVMYEGSSSEKLAVIVTEEQNQVWPGIPLPKEYWARPINAQFREWSAIGGDWLAYNNDLFVPFNEDAPETAHILWAKPIIVGGLVGGNLGDHQYEDGDAYEGFFGYSFGGESPVIIGGRLFFNRYKADGATRVQQDVVCIDLHTGKELWVRNWNNTRLRFGQVFYWDSFNYHGAFPYLWTSVGSTWNAYDPLDGRWVYGMTNVPTGPMRFGSKGEIYITTVNQANGWMTQWNSSRAVQPQTTGSSGDGSWIRGRMGTMIDARTTGFDWNVTIPTGLPGSVNYVLEDRVIGSTGSTRGVQQMIERNDGPIVFWAVNTKPGQEGQLLFNKTWQPPAGTTVSLTGASVNDGVFTISAKESRQHFGFNIDTGNMIWGPTASQHYLDLYSIIFSQRSGMIAYGKLFSCSMSGKLYCYDVKTGNLLGNYSYQDPLNEVLWSNDWSIRVAFIADGKVYLGQSEHSPVDPKPRGAPFVCVDVETGQEVWSIPGGFRQTDWGSRAIIGDSIMATMDSYDQRVYAVGKGPSSTTVQTPLTGVSFGSSLMICGTVNDISPGTKDDEIALRFPNGVPAVSDESMSEWMKYVYMQFPKPTDTKGIEVAISVLDSNNNYREIGKTMTNQDGYFSFNWKPDIEGQYTVYASFEGSKSYWPSHAVAAFAVDPAPATPTPTQLPITSMLDQYFIPAVAGIAVLIIACFVVTILLLRKRP